MKFLYAETTLSESVVHQMCEYYSLLTLYGDILVDQGFRLMVAELARLPSPNTEVPTQSVTFLLYNVITELKCNIKKKSTCVHIKTL